MSEPVVVTSDRARLPALDGVRAIAALSVLVFHVGFNTGLPYDNWVGQLVTRLDWGVCLFFVLSGYLLSGPFIRASLPGGSVRMRVYAERRALRILPLYWISLAVVVWLHSGTIDSPGQVARTALLIQPYTNQAAIPGFEQSWSIATEAVFYALLPTFPFLVSLMRPRDARSVLQRWWLLTAALVLLGIGSTWVAWQTLTPDPVISSTWFLQLAPWFAGGIALAVHEESRRVGLPGWRLLTDVGSNPGACVALAFGSFALSATLWAGNFEPLSIVPLEQVIPRRLLYLGAAVLLVLPATVADSADTGSRSVVLRSLSADWLRHVGLISYGIFLWHLLALDLALRWWDLEPFSGGFWRILITTLVVSLVLAEISWRLVERPLQNYSHRRRLAPHSVAKGV